jgi:thiol-disulfide isomerase/thioredoxin
LIGNSIEKAAAQLAYQQWKLTSAPDPKYVTAGDGGEGGDSGVESPLVGKPAPEFDLALVGGKRFRLSASKGKVVVLDFWATWCGPCVAEMPNMKQLYAKYHDKGVEFIGVSLDQPKEDGGLDALKKYVKENEIAWPQYYQGNYWESEFSMSWGINSIPTMFLVDQDGKLVSVEARGKLETMIPDLLKKKDAAAGTGTGAGGQ